MENVAEAPVNLEAERIKTLKKYDILDTPPDGSFDRIVKLASILLDVPIALVTLVDSDRIWFKSHYGLDTPQIGRDPGLCASAILSDEIYLVEDALKDPRTLANPLVAGEFGLKFYAAAPLKVKEGHNLGTFCVIDKNPRQFTQAQKEILQSLADIVVDQLELRLAARKAVFNQNQLLNMAVHDLKSPLTAISISAEFIKNEKNESKNIAVMCDQILKSAGKMTNTINAVLESSRIKLNKIQLRITKINLANLVGRVVITNQILAKNKHQKLQLDIENHPFVCADESKLIEITDNLINNAIKYSPENKNITITIAERNNKAIMEVLDEGQGLDEEDKKNLFQPFTKLSAQPTGGENSTGLGLSIVKVLVEAHKGNIRAESDGKNKGAKFIVELPAI
ncbi:MAG: GAF domain-containing sensor histidine kinase [Bacteroidota bacterium]|nr:GAF domain-containing sensor histidine kinase [Bacteroidota bacterium]